MQLLLGDHVHFFLHLSREILLGIANFASPKKGPVLLSGRQPLEPIKSLNSSEVSFSCKYPGREGDCSGRAIAAREEVLRDF
ncbi:hypothetical protein OIU77_014013 [Salix suchowensis]|uniref:Uncharacterized protein n=1 Tax=Salix suchowensis TaxID=1278906 RepID=A0ABQ8ZVU8_9ROSI|nr:hypothetical protein OIU77_014013 [Salix suchowensis]